MTFTAVSGKVVWSSNSVVTITSGSSYTSSTVGSMTNGNGFVVGGGGSGSISTTQKNVERARIALFDGGERNIEVNTDPLFSPGNVATIVYRNGDALAYYNQTTDMWYHHGFRLPFSQKLAVLAMWVLAAFLVWKTVGAFRWLGFIDNMKGGFFSYFRIDDAIAVFSAVFYPAAAVGLMIAAIRFVRKKKPEIQAAVIRLIREHDSRYEKEIVQSQEAWRKMLAEL